MSSLEWIVPVGVGITIGVVATSLIIANNKRHKQEDKDALIKCFGEPMYAGEFSFEEAVSWISKRKNLLSDSVKAVITKIKPELLEKIGAKADINGEVENYLLMAILNEKTIVESVLVKYEQLDDELEKRLLSGEGTMVVEA